MNRKFSLPSRLALNTSTPLATSRTEQQLDSGGKKNSSGVARLAGSLLCCNPTEYSELRLNVGHIHPRSSLRHTCLFGRWGDDGNPPKTKRVAMRPEILDLSSASTVREISVWANMESPPRITFGCD